MKALIISIALKYCWCGTFETGIYDYQVSEGSCCTGVATEAHYNTYEYSEGAWIHVTHEPMDSQEAQSACC